MSEVVAPPRFFRDWLREWTTEARWLFRSEARMRPHRVECAAEELVRKLGDLTPRTPTKYEIEQTVGRLVTAWNTSHSFSQVEKLHLRRSPWALFFPHDRPEHWLARNRSFTQAWLGWWVKRAQASVVVALIREFLAVYPTDLTIFDNVRHELRGRVIRGEGPRLARWRERCERFGLLEPDATRRFLSDWWRTEIGFEEYLAEAGLAPGLEGSAFVERVTAELLDQAKIVLRTAHASERQCRRAFAWLEREGSLRFPHMKVEVASALLSPFVDHKPAEDVRKAICEFLCNAIGDPRIRRSTWHDVPEVIRNVLLRWLVGASLEDFFRVLDRTALDRHWLFRKAFWWAYFERDHIQDAWVVLGPAADAIVRKGFGGETRAARLRKGNVQPNHSVLLMRIGGLTIAEWSHNGKCRIWRRGSGSAPQLYEAEYGRSDLVRDCDWEQSHFGAEQGTWQAWVARLIEDETGIRVPHNAYMPRGRR